MFGALGSSSTISDIVSSSLLGTAVLKLNSMIRSESGLWMPVTSADVRCFRSTIKKSVPGDSIGGRVSEAYIVGLWVSATILRAGNRTDLVWKMNPFGLMLDDAANNKFAHRRTKIFQQCDERKIFHISIIVGSVYRRVMPVCSINAASQPLRAS